MNFYLLNEKMKDKRGKYRTLYYIGIRPAEPKPYSRSKYSLSLSKSKEAWTRPYKKEPVKSGVFLTPDPIRVYLNHYLLGNVYAYKVSEKVIRMSGGINIYDSAAEILIDEETWRYGIDNDEIIFLGKSMDSQELVDKGDKRRERNIRFDYFRKEKDKNRNKVGNIEGEILLDKWKKLGRY